MHRSLLAIACMASAACSRSSASIEITTVDFDVDDAPVLVQFGHGWPSASQQPAVPPRAYTPSSSEQPAVAFLDINRNGRFDPFREPSGRCDSRGGMRACSIDRERLTVQRIVNGRLALSSGLHQVVGDQALVVLEAYDTHGNVSLETTACLEDAPDVCARFGGHAFVSPKTGARAIPLCDLDLVASAAPAAVRVRTAGSERVAHVVAPPRLGVHVTWKLDSSMLEVTARSESPLTQAMVWIGSADEAVWSTEDATSALRWTAHEATVSIPLEVIESCSTCTVMVQLGAFVDHADASQYVEERISIVRGT